MNIFYFAFLLAFFLYGLFFERTITIIQGIIFGAYMVGYFKTKNSPLCSIRRKIMIAVFKGQINTIIDINL